jgi:hypothetical protein
VDVVLWLELLKVFIFVPELNLFRLEVLQFNPGVNMLAVMAFLVDLGHYGHDFFPHLANTEFI